MVFSLSQEIGASLLRALFVAGAVVPAAMGLLDALRPKSTKTQRTFWALLALLFLTPALFTGYAYANFTPWLTWQGFVREAGYDLLLFFRNLLPAALLLTLVKPRISASALFQLRAAPCSPQAFRAWILHTGAAQLLAGTLIFLLVFTEFEYASFFQVEAWTVKLFDAQVGGMLLKHALLEVLPAAAIACGLLIWVYLLYRSITAYPPQVPHPTRKATSPLLLALPVLGVLIVVLLPAALLSRDLINGVALLADGFLVGQELRGSLLVSALSASLAYTLCYTRFARVLALPGLFGTLILGLTLLALFQTNMLHSIYDTLLPLWMATTLWLMPCALIFRVAMQHRNPHSALHIATGSQQASTLRWAMLDRYRFSLFLFLFCLSWFDLTIASLLAPSTLTPLPVRLYNFMHYGQSARLSAMVLVSIFTPALVALIIYPLAKHGARLCGR
jgi:iron(III) transport system permease protein